MITLTDESSSVRRPGQAKPRETKNHRSRSLPIKGQLKDVLLTLDQGQGALVFRGPKQGVLSDDVVRRTLIRDVLGPLAKTFPTPDGAIGFAHGRLHSFRHYFCSTCANSSVPEQVVMNWLGHRESAMVRHYYHLHDHEAQQQMQRLDFVGNATRHVGGQQCLHIFQGDSPDEQHLLSDQEQSADSVANGPESNRTTCESSPTAAEERR